MTNTATDALAHRQFTMSLVSHQDGLLQQYRLQRLVFEVALAILVTAIGFGLSSVPYLQLVLLTVTLWLHQRAGAKHSAAIRFRATDVDFSHRELLLAEAQLAAGHRTFTRFKIAQDRDPTTLPEKTRIFLTDRDTPATQAEVDQYFFAHRSNSRGVSAALVRLPGLLTRWLGLAAVAAALVQLVTG